MGKKWNADLRIELAMSLARVPFKPLLLALCFDLVRKLRMPGQHRLILLESESGTMNGKDVCK